MAPNLFTRIRLILHGLCRATSANVAVVFALTLPVVVGAAGLGIETSYWYYSSLKLQATADAAAYAGALEKITGSDTAAITAAATQSATDNGLGNGTITVHTPPTSGPNTANKAVEVILNQNLDRVFTSIFSASKVPEQIVSRRCGVSASRSASRSRSLSHWAVTAISGVTWVTWAAG